MNLYPDQVETIERVREAMRHSKSVLLQSPTGSGKTAMAIDMIRRAKNKENRIIFVVPRKDLLEQTSETFTRLGIAHSYIAAGKPYNPFAHVFVGMVETMARRVANLPDAPLLIVDEARYGEKAMDAVIGRYKASGSWILGLDATPWKLSGKGLGCWYDTMVHGRSVAWLIENKRLSDYRYFHGRTKIDLSKVKITAGDYAKGEIAGFMEHQGVIIGDCVKDYQQRCAGRIHIVRCASIKHSQMVAQRFRDAGIEAMHVDGETTMPARRRIFQAFARREILVLTFCELLGFGFDLSQSAGMDVCIESGSDLRPTKSLAGQMQFWGRMLRYKETPAIIQDHVNNCIEHGLPCDEREWTLEDRIQGKSGDSARASPVRSCSVCYFVHSPRPSCPNCGHVYPIQSRVVASMDGELSEIERAPLKLSSEQYERLNEKIAVLTKRGLGAGVPAWRVKAWATKKALKEIVS